MQSRSKSGFLSLTLDPVDARMQRNGIVAPAEHDTGFEGTGVLTKAQGKRRLLFRASLPGVYLPNQPHQDSRGCSHKSRPSWCR